MAVITEKKIAVLSNPLAGVGKAVTLGFRIQELLQQRQVRFETFRDHWPEKLDGFTHVFLSGGDGTMNYFVNQYPDCRIPITLFNGGTGNDLHWALYGKMTTEAQVEHALDADPRPLDAGSCNGKLFMNGLGIGFEGQIARDLTGKKKAPGKISFMRSVLKNILFYRSNVYTISMNGKDIREKCLFISIMNGKRAGGGFYISPESVITDGKLDVIRIGKITPVMRLRYLPVIEKGKHLSLPFVHPGRADSITIGSEQEIRYHLDGEYHSATHLQIECLPAKFLFHY